MPAYPHPCWGRISPHQLSQTAAALFCVCRAVAVQTGAGNLVVCSGLRAIHLFHLDLLCVHSFKKYDVSLLSALYVACVVLGPGD